MILMTYKDTAYLVLPAARSLILGHYYFTNRMPDYSKGDSTPNSPILPECKTLKTVFSSSAKSETRGAFENVQNVIPLRHILETIYLPE